MGPWLPRGPAVPSQDRAPPASPRAPNGPEFEAGEVPGLAQGAEHLPGLFLSGWATSKLPFPARSLPASRKSDTLLNSCINIIFWGQTLLFQTLNPVLVWSPLLGAGQRRSGRPLVLTLGCPKPARTGRDAEPPVPPWTPHPLLGTPFWVWHFGVGFSSFGGSCSARPHPEFYEA